MPSRPRKSGPPSAAGNALKSANSGNSTLRRTGGFLTPGSPSPCSICSMIAAASSPAQSFTSGNSCSPTLTSCPPRSWPTAAPCRSMSITTVIFFTHDPDALTQLGWALKFYDISFLYAPTPQAKGKIERAHQYWQGRLPAYFASEKITEIEVANPHIDALRAHRNAREVHRELRQTPNGPGTKPGKKNVPCCARHPVARGGIMCGACARPSRSAATVACPSARNDCASKNHPKPRWCFASIPPATIPCWPPPPIPNQKPVLLFTNRHQ